MRDWCIDDQSREKGELSVGEDCPATSFVLDNQLSRVNNLLSCCIIKIYWISSG